ncbi:MAG: hypothetical protein ACRC0L_06200, partial [Angustibacter sp.]
QHATELTAATWWGTDRGLSIFGPTRAYAASVSYVLEASAELTGRLDGALGARRLDSATAELPGELRFHLPEGMTDRLSPDLGESPVVDLVPSPVVSHERVVRLRRSEIVEELIIEALEAAEVDQRDVSIVENLGRMAPALNPASLRVLLDFGPGPQSLGQPVFARSGQIVGRIVVQATVLAPRSGPAEVVSAAEGVTTSFLDESQDWLQNEANHAIRETHVSGVTLEGTTTIGPVLLSGAYRWAKDSSVDRSHMVLLLDRHDVRITFAPQPMDIQSRSVQWAVRYVSTEATPAAPPPPRTVHNALWVAVAREGHPLRQSGPIASPSAIIGSGLPALAPLATGTPAPRALTPGTQPETAAERLVRRVANGFPAGPGLSGPAGLSDPLPVRRAALDLLRQSGPRFLVDGQLPDGIEAALTPANFNALLPALLSGTVFLPLDSAPGVGLIRSAGLQ